MMKFHFDGIVMTLEHATHAELLQAVQHALFAMPANQKLSTNYTSNSRDRSPSCQFTVTAARHPESRWAGQTRMTRGRSQNKGTRPCN